MKAPTQVSNRILPPKGTHIARVIELIYEGTQKVEWKGETKEQAKVRIKWELPYKTAVFKEGEPEKPFVVNAEYTHSMGSKSNLRPIVEGILDVSLTDEEAKNFDLDEILNKSCLLSISHKENDRGKFVVVNSTAPLMDGQRCPPPVNSLRVLSFEKWDEEMFESLPSFIKEKIMLSPEYKRLKGLVVPKEETPAYPKEDNDLSIPF